MRTVQKGDFMIKIKHMSDKELKELGRRVGEAFCAENEGIVLTVPRGDMVKAFEIMTEYYYRAGVLYATSPQCEGLLAYWHKKEKMRLGPALHMIFRMLREMRFKSVLKVAQSGDDLYSKVYRRESDYIIISMVVVFPEYQGKGYLRKVLELPFSEAEAGGILCVLDTDTKLKVNKYTSCNMKKTAEKKLKSGCLLYTMEYRPDTF